jgi:hypothetical protein
LGFGLCLAQINMPDPGLIHGKAIPAPELPAGTVTVRVVREAIGNDIAGQRVRLTVGSTIRTATTDAQGRAEFTNLPPGEARAEAVVGTERLTSDPFRAPSSGGLRVILVAGLKDAAARAQREAAAAAAAPPVPGVIVFGPNSRILMEFRDDTLQVFYVLDILNTARTRVDIGGPLLVDLPTGAAGASLLSGSPPTATISGGRLTVTGPFATGNTSVQVAFTLRYDAPNLAIRQTWPAPLEQVTVAIEKVGAVSLASPQFSTVGEVRAESGTPFLLASGAALPAGGTLTMNLSGLPVHSRIPRYVALGIAAGITSFGFWLAFTGRRAGARLALVQHRDALLAALVALDKSHTDKTAVGPEGARYAEHRQRLLAELEQVYGELDEAAGGPQGGGEGIAA